MIIPHLETILCDTAEARDLHHRVRYRVFCEETGFERADDFPDRREVDQYDDEAAHFLVLDRLRQRWIGAMRLIQGKVTRLPLESICESKIAGLDGMRFQSIELSRLSVVNTCVNAEKFTSYAGNQRTFITTSETVRKSCGVNQHEALARMIWATLNWGKQNDVQQVYGLATAPLVRILKRLGLPATAAGTEVRYRGLRRPYLYDVEESLEGIRLSLPKLGYFLDSDKPFVPFSTLNMSYPRDRDQSPAPPPALEIHSRSRVA